jgi:hypothetical protein
VEGGERAVRVPPVELQGEQELGPGEVELVGPAPDADPVPEGGRRQAGAGEEPEQVDLPPGVARRVPGRPLGEHLAQGDRRPSTRSGVDPLVALAQRGEADEAAPQPQIDGVLAHPDVERLTPRDRPVLLRGDGGDDPVVAHAGSIPTGCDTELCGQNTAASAVV